MNNNYLYSNSYPYYKVRFIRFFSNSRVLWTEPNDRLARMQELIDKNKALFEESKKELEFKECFRTLIEDKNKVIAARNEEDYKMRTYLSNGMRFFNEEDFKKYNAEENSKKIHELFQKKIEDLNKDSDKRSYEYQSETLKLEIALRKSINKMSDNIESITNNAIERSLSEGNASEEKILLHKIARGSRLKERQDYFDKESQLVSKIKKNLLTWKSSLSESNDKGEGSSLSGKEEGSSLSGKGESNEKKETPIDFVVGLSQTEMPSYTDPED